MTYRVEVEANEENQYDANDHDDTHYYQEVPLNQQCQVPNCEYNVYYTGNKRIRWNSHVGCYVCNEHNNMAASDRRKKLKAAKKAIQLLEPNLILQPRRSGRN